MQLTGTRAAAALGVDEPTRQLVEGISSVLRAVRCAEHRQVWPDGGVRRADATVLRLLAYEGELRAGEIAHRLGVDASVVSRQLASLDADGLVSRRPDPADARVSLASVTDEGRQRLGALYASYVKRLHAALDGWNDDDMLAAAVVLKRVAAAIVPDDEL